MVKNTVKSTAEIGKPGILKNEIKKERRNFDFTGPSRRASLSCGYLGHYIHEVSIPLQQMLQ